MRACVYLSVCLCVCVSVCRCVGVSVCRCVCFKHAFLFTQAKARLFDDVLTEALLQAVAEYRVHSPLWLPDLVL